MDEIYVLVYGSLKYACGNHAIMQSIGAKCLGYDSITGEFEMISYGAFPGVVQYSKSGGLTTILGELYAVNEAGLASIDMLEGHPNFYERFIFRTDRMDRNAWMYTLPSKNSDTTRTYSAAAIWEPTESEQNFWRDQP